MTGSLPAISSIHERFFRHGKQYCLFSIAGRDHEFIYYSHESLPLRSLMFGSGFADKVTDLMKREDLCIECGLGLSSAGGVVFDTGDLRAWNCAVSEANGILVALRDHLGEDGQWIELF